MGFSMYIERESLHATQSDFRDLLRKCMLDFTQEDLPMVHNVFESHAKHEGVRLMFSFLLSPDSSAPILSIAQLCAMQRSNGILDNIVY